MFIPREGPALPRCSPCGPATLCVYICVSKSLRTSQNVPQPLCFCSNLFPRKKVKKNTHIYTFRNDIAQSMKYPPRTQHTYTHKANRDTQHATQENKCNLKVRWWLILIDGRRLQSPGRASSPSSVGGGHWEEIHQIDRSLKLGVEREKQNQSMNLVSYVCVCESEREKEREGIVCRVCGREEKGREKICGTKSTSGSVRPNSL